MAFSISTFIFTQYTDSCTSNLVFSIPMWFLCSCLNICICNWDGIVTHLPFTAILSTMANSCLTGQYFVCLVPNLHFCAASPLWYMPCSCRCISLAVTSYTSNIDVQTGRSTDVTITLTLMLRPHISLYLFSLWLHYDSHSAMNNSGPGLYRMCTLYWGMHRITHCRHCDNVATSLPIIATNGLWSVMTCTSQTKQ